MAAAAGLPLVGENRHAEQTTTYGVGQLLLDAVRRGCTRVVMGLGGSATNDLGCGAAAAAGVRFLDKEGREFVPVGGTLDEIRDIDLVKAKENLSGVTITAMCDIDNPLYGRNGAAYVFGPQKGADEKTVEVLDGKLQAASETVKKILGLDIAEMPGAGAAGGMGYGTVAFLGAQLRMGIEAVLDTVRFDDLVRDADLVLTGEGRIDSQSLRGKVVVGVARRAKKAGVPVVAIVGGIAGDMAPAYDEGIAGIFSINRAAIAFEQAKPLSADNLYHTIDNLIRYTLTMRR